MMRFAKSLGVAVLVLGAALASAQTAGAQEGRVIGKLGQAINGTKIFAGMSNSARVYWTLKPNDYVVVNPTQYDKWLSVLLKNGKKGYVLADDVASLPYDVTIPEKQARQIASGGGGGSMEVQEMLQFSYRFVGTPYKWGGNSLTGGIDCSGFLVQIFKRRGVNLPRTADEQSRFGTKIERLEDLRPGDRLYFWDNRRNKVGHCGLFMGFFQDGGAYFIHSSVNNKGIDTDDLRNPKWRNMLVGARRD